MINSKSLKCINQHCILYKCRQLVSICLKETGCYITRTGVQKGFKKVFEVIEIGKQLVTQEVIQGLNGWNQMALSPENKLSGEE